MPSKHDRFMKEALKEAQKAFRKGEVPIGAVLVKNHRVVAKGHNQRRALDDPTAHAEMVCLRNFGMKETKGTTLYSTLEPCPMCSGAIIQTGIPKVLYGEKDLLYGACGTAFNHLNRAIKSLKHSVLREECRQILLTFFEKELGRRSTRWFDIQLPK